MDDRSGIGAEPRGPSFVPWQVDGAPPPGSPISFRTGRSTVPPTAASTAPTAPLTAPPTAPPTGSASERAPYPGRPPRDPWPTVLTVLAFVIVGAVVAVASLVAERPQSRPTTAPVVAPVSAAPVRSDRMEFVTETGDGVLVLTSRRWTASGSRPPIFGSYLHIEVELICTTGQLSYSPENFSAFDAVGDLFEVTGTERQGTPLGNGTLGAGEGVRGTIAFDIPRGDATLLMSDNASRSVTALKIPD